MSYKFIFIAALEAFAAALFGYFFSAFALTNSSPNLIPAAAFGLIYIALFSLRILITERARHAALCIALDLLFFAVPFLNHASVWLFASAVITGLWLFFIWRAGRNAINNMVRIRLYNLSAVFAKPLIRAILFLCVASYLSLVNPAHIAVSREMVASFAKTINSQYGSIIMQNITDQFTPAKNNQTIEKAVDAIHALLNKTINLVPPNMKTALLIGAGIIIFLMANSAVSLIAPFINGLISMLIALLLRINFIKIKTEATAKETIVAV